MDIDFSINAYLAAHQSLVQNGQLSGFEKGIDIVKLAFDRGAKIVTCGNGGSASTASHYITDWNKMVNIATQKKFRGVCLTDNVGLITAYGNDLDYSEVFAGQVRAVMDPGDLLIVVSGSGNSLNVLKAADEARATGCQVLGVVGYDGGKLMPKCDHSVWVKSFDMQLCEDVHLMFGHMVMKTLCASKIRVS